MASKDHSTVLQFSADFGLYLLGWSSSHGGWGRGLKSSGMVG